MTKAEIENQLNQFLKEEKNCPPSKLNDLCKQYGMRRLLQRQPSKFGKRNTKIPITSWEEVNLDSYEFAKPIVVCLSGNGTTDTALANGFCKTVENMLGLLFQGQKVSGKPLDYVDLLGCAYGKNKKYLYLPENEQVKQLYNSPNDYAKDFPHAVKDCYNNNDLAPEEINKFANSLLVKKCIDNKGNKLSIDKCCQNLSQITFCSFCYGSKAVNLIMDDFENQLKTYDFSKEEISVIKNSMAHISFARLEYARNIPSTYFYSVDDYDISSMLPLAEEMDNMETKLKIKHCKQGENAFGQLIYPHKFGTVTDCEALEYVYKGVSQEDGPCLEHYVSNMSRDVDWNIINKNCIMYDAISQMMSWALCRAVENGLQNTKASSYIPKKSMAYLNDEIVNIYENFKLEKAKE